VLDSSSHLNYTIFGWIFATVYGFLLSQTANVVMLRFDTKLKLEVRHKLHSPVKPLGCVCSAQSREQFALRVGNFRHQGSVGFMPSCPTSWTSASSLFPVCHYWSNWL